jgi:hypothetical protein
MTDVQDLDLQKIAAEYAGEIARADTPKKKGDLYEKMSNLVSGASVAGTVLQRRTALVHGLMTLSLSEEVFSTRPVAVRIFNARLAKLVENFAAKNPVYLMSILKKLEGTPQDIPEFGALYVMASRKMSLTEEGMELRHYIVGRGLSFFLPLEVKEKRKMLEFCTALDGDISTLAMYPRYSSKAGVWAAALERQMLADGVTRDTMRQPGALAPAAKRPAKPRKATKPDTAPEN